MQKLIIIRGHSGSGKSTFAQQKIAEFQAKYPNAYIFHIENDQYLMKDGQYHWTPLCFNQAKKQAEQALDTAFQFAQKHSKADLLIVISNVGSKAAPIYRVINKAQKQAMQTEVYRMQNFFQNTHHVDQTSVYSMFIDIQRHPIAEEICVPAVKPMSEEDKRMIAAMCASNAKI